MIKSMRDLLFLLLTITACFQCQVINKEKKLNLQSNELYVQNLSEFINEAATQIDLRTSEGVQEIQAFQSIKTYQNSKPLEVLATLVFKQVKYIIGVTSQAAADSKYKFEVLFQKIQFDDTCKCLVQIPICSVASEVVNQIPEIFASIYDSQSGFVSYQIGEEYKTFGFKSDGTYMEYSNIQWLKLSKHVSIQNYDLSIYVIQSINQKYQLIKLSKDWKQIFIKEIPADKCDLSVPLIDSTKFYYMYCYQGDQTYLKAFWVNEFVEALSFQNFQNVPQYLPKSYTFNRIGSQFLIGLFGAKSSNILTISSNESLNDFVFTLSNTEIPFIAAQKSNFMNEKFLIFHQDNYLLFFDIVQKQIVYQTQVANDGLLINSAQSLGNQIILDLVDINQKYSNSIVAQVNLPSFKIQLKESTTNPIQIVITTISQTKVYVNIKVNIVEQNTVLFTSNYVYTHKNIQSLNDNKVQILPIEDQVIGADLQLNASQDEYIQLMKDVSFIKTIDLEVQKDILPSISSSCNSYQLDGYFSTLFVCPLEAGIQLQYVRADSTDNNSNNKIGVVDTYKSQILQQRSINQVDNQGSFIIIQTNPQIYLPYLNNEHLQFATYPIFCNDNNFSFASDPAFGIFFTFCKNYITMYQYQNNNNQLSAALDIIQNTSLNQLICIDGILFAYNKTSITAYDYIQFSFLGQITIPTEGTNQQITLFKSTFLITILDNPLTKIAQYSYNNFASSTPTFMRYLQIDDSHPVDNQGLIVAKRSGTELAFILSSTQNLYYIYRVNSKQWSNQLYSSISFNLQQTVINNLNVCQLDIPFFKLILQQASIKYELDLTTEQFNQKFFSFTLLTLKPPKQEKQTEKQLNLKSLKSSAIQRKRTLQVNWIQYALSINRDASAAFGILNQQSNFIQQLKTQVQDIQFFSNDVSNVLNLFSNSSLYNACLTGWQSLLPNAKISQRISATSPKILNQDFTILYKYRLQIEDKQITSFFSIQGNFKNCLVLDDKASLKSTSYLNLNYQFNLYVFCQKKLQQYQVEYSIDNQIAQNIVSSKVSEPIIYYFNNNYNLSIYTQLISYNSQIYLFSVGGMNPQLLVLNKIQKQALIQELTNSYLVKKSINFMSKSNVYIQIYSSGLIQFQQNSQEKIQALYIQDMLWYFSFSITDYIKQVIQYSDSQFRIQFANSFIYDVTFQFNQQQQLQILSASQYYYQDAFSQFISGFKGTTYTILFGYSNTKQLCLALYENSASLQGINLIQSVYQFEDKVASNQTPTFITQQTPEYMELTLSNAYHFTILISDHIGIQVFNNQQMAQQNLNKIQIQIAPNIQKNPYNTINMTATSIPSQNPSSKTYIQNLFYNLISIIIIFFI
ncbi:hypothetical protein TTHERM_00699850 (macronuclear) [Tetrahymena thermophila SB210]|uniref:Transmembrane protein n=1 Tax=Tetrahymena thermophila (strain SB210) TaxID=312017 RepID=Q22LR5_TETTS|nr:hypothetical protein TTHERM_00699850 [Tetrahymena thermophila SB210]EAR86201.2 hypothetical protein TTHERM_00699850 [Tetrahymena thermophila SB210]|eukprot:XP_976796.2 hypothetical protein TTHERM_00699850 [Tetrahymena thermophila SB210]